MEMACRWIRSDEILRDGRWSISRRRRHETVVTLDRQVQLVEQADSLDVWCKDWKIFLPCTFHVQPRFPVPADVALVCPCRLVVCDFFDLFEHFSSLSGSSAQKASQSITKHHTTTVFGSFISEHNPSLLVLCPSC